ncbi:MAG TPA: ATPase [Gammaproteobacteria bacterium]|nr:ATPase [Gammaproteobacteria bacterium]
MSDAHISWISGPVLRATTHGVFRINESVLIGAHKLLGEVIRIEGNNITVQIYEDTTGLRPGDPVKGTGSELSVRLGPGLLGNIYDGLLRPLNAQGRHVQQGYVVPASGKHFPFRPSIKPGQQLNAGHIIGHINQQDARSLLCLAPPDCQGRVISVAAAGEYTEDEVICEIECDDGNTKEVCLSQHWPVRRPRPIKERIPTEGPLLTGQRIFDSLFPLACGGRAAMPGGFGTGKTVLQETLAKWCDADIIIYVGCGERGNEMAGVLHEFPSLDDPLTGRPLMERTVIIANTSNMPVAAREASIYTAVTVGEYFRDQGMRVALMADSTSRWAESLREISGRLGELPSEAGYPAYLSSRLADFYERAAHVRTLSGSVGSLSIIGAISPPSADFSEPVTTHTKRYVRCFWALDPTRAHARFYPAVNPLLSYSQDTGVLSDYWKQQGNPEWPEQRRRFLTLLEQQSRLERMARIVGKDALPLRQRHVLMCAELINDAFLRQSAYSEIDRFCSPDRQIAMMQIIMHFIEQTETAIADGVSVDQITRMKVMRRLRRMNEDIAEDELEKYHALQNSLDSELAQLTKGASNAG